MYVVSTPIGNLEDITLRALNVLRDVAMIVAEDTRHTAKLLSRFEIRNRLISCHDYNEKSRVQEILGHIENGEAVAMVTDAGTPTVSDPGFLLIRTAIERGIPVHPVPGVSAAITAVSVSGFPTDAFIFIGFPPKKQGRRKAQLKTLAPETRTLIFYESPKRIASFIHELKMTFGDRPAVLGREMTKIHEEFLRGTLSEIADVLEERPVIKGECTLVVAGASDELPCSEELLASEISRGLKSQSLKPSALAKHIAKMTGIPRKTVYDEILKQMEGRSAGEEDA